MAEFALRETLEVVERRIARAGSNGAIDNRERFIILAVLKKSERLLEGGLRIGGLGRGKTWHSDDEGCQTTEQHTTQQTETARCVRRKDKFKMLPVR